MMTTPEAQTIMERCDQLGSYSEESGRRTRPYGSAALREVNILVGNWMRQAGMSVQSDAVGNLIGRYEGSDPAARTLLLGSHLDTVRDAGRYDGPLGVLTALACIEQLHKRGERLPFALELLAFADEEGLRYHYTYLGSKVITGQFDKTALELQDTQGITLAEAIRTFGGNPDPAVLCRARWRPDELLGYLELHIEQGPVLEARGLPVGVVSAIAGMSRFLISFAGEAGHAGTVPMEQRHDALCAASAFVLGVEQRGKATPGLVATVGQFNIQPGASNVIPGQVTLSLDVRHQEDALREQASSDLQALAESISRERQISLAWQKLQTSQAIPCTPRLMQLFQQAIRENGYPVLTLPSGAGHDGVSLSKLTDIAMLFVRCRKGISHNPAEAVETADVAVALTILERALQLLSTPANDHP